MIVVSIPTPRGEARAHLQAPAAPRGALLLGHGAGGGIDAPDLLTAAEVALAAGLGVVRVEQPYRVAGRRAPAPAAHLDEAWLAVAARLRSGPLAGLPLIFGGRSSGARVACRTAPAGDAIAVLCLAFPLQPPARAGSGRTPVSRRSELDGAGVPTLVIQGQRDAFGIPEAGPQRSVVTVAGDHRLRSDREGLAAALSAWLAQLRR